MLVIAFVAAGLLVLVSFLGGEKNGGHTNQSPDEILIEIREDIENLKTQEWSAETYHRVLRKIDNKFENKLISKSQQQQLSEGLKAAYSLKLAEAIQTLCMKAECTAAETEKTLSIFEKELHQLPNGEMAQLIADYRLACRTCNGAISNTNNGPFKAAVADGNKLEINRLIYLPYLKKNESLKVLADEALARQGGHKAVSVKFSREVLVNDNYDCGTYKDFGYYSQLCELIADWVQLSHELKEYLQKNESTESQTSKFYARLQPFLDHEFFQSTDPFKRETQKAKDDLNSKR